MRHILPALLLALFALPGHAQEYLGSQRCVTCHADAGEAWRGSHHALAWTEATPENIAADFNDTRFRLGGMEAHFTLSEDGRPQVSVTELDGVTTRYPVHSVIGVEPLQQYILESEPGRLQSFDVVWDTEKGEWFHLYPDQNPAPDDGLHWTGHYKTWNSRCASCHATNYRANYSLQTRSFASTQTEIGVGCEACHGPGSAHAEWAERQQESQTPPPAHYGFPIDMSDPATAMGQCAGCHSRREAYFDGNPVPGTRYQDAFNLSLLRPGLYEADGQILEEVYVYGSFLQSKMAAKGVACTDCHLPHEASLIAKGNAVCTQCHSPAGNPRFPSLPLAVFDGPEHTHHPEGSDGAQCKSCHMVERVYMGNDWRADHSFRIPRPDLNAVTGAPDACTGCHTDESADWAAEKIAGWFPDSDKRGPHYGEVLAHGRRDPVGTASDLQSLALAPDQPALVRATAIWLLEQAGDAGQAEELAKLVEDPDPWVRSAAVKLQAVSPPATRAQALLTALQDSSRSVRIAAAQAALGMPIAHLPERFTAAMRRTYAEWQAALAGRLDYPETHLQLAGAALTTRNLPAAAAAFAEATRLDPQLVDAWIMQVRIAAALQRRDEVGKLLNEALAKNPESQPLRMMQAELAGESDPERRQAD